MKNYIINLFRRIFRIPANGFRIFWSDIKAASKNPIMMIILIGIVILPSLYAWVNILASTDPYSSTGGIKIAVANLDEGGSLFDEQLDIGDNVIDQLHENDKMGWTFYDTREEAIQAVISADAYAAIVIPEDFSADICTMFDNPVKPNLEYYVNMKTNAIAPKMTNAAVETLQDSIKQQIISTVVETIYNKLNIVGDGLSDNSDLIRRGLDTLYDSESIIVEIPNKVQTARDQAQSVLDKAEEKKPAVDSVIALLERTQTTIANLAVDLENLDSKISYYEPLLLQAMEDAGAVMDEINDASDSLLNIHQKIQQILSHFKYLSQLINKLNEALLGGNDIGTILSDISNTTAEISDLAKSVKSELENNILPKIHQYLGEATDISTEVFNKIDDGLADIDAAMSLAEKLMDKGKEILGKTDEFLDVYPNYANKVLDVIDKVKTIDENIDLNTVINLLMANAQDEGNFFANPVEISEEDYYPTENYGAAMTPFYTTLCLWVGAVILCAILTTEAKNAPFPYTRRQEYLGKWLLFVSLAILQGLLVALGDIFLLKISIVHPVIFVLLTMLLSLIFTTIVFSFVFQFGDVGKAIAVILLVLQIAGSGGTFPIECTPQFFQKIYALLPFTYAINAMREAVAGIYMPNLLFDLAILLAYLIIFLAIGLISKHWIKKITIDAEKKMKESGLTE